MTKIRSTLDELKASMTEQQRREYDEEYTSLLIDEMIAAAMESDDVSVQKLAKAAGLSSTYCTSGKVWNTQKC
jgi:hypothetical protein